MANRELEDLLESDDELPSYYDEDADLPAYQMDHRFETIDFPWIDNQKYFENCLPNNGVSSELSISTNKNAPYQTQAKTDFPMSLSSSQDFPQLRQPKSHRTKTGVEMVTSTNKHFLQLDQATIEFPIEIKKTVKTGRQTSKDKKLIKKGILSKRDLLCIRCVAAISTGTTLLWFINFLMQKDMQSDYNFLKSCLVQDITVMNKDLVNEKASTELKKYPFQIIIK